MMSIGQVRVHLDTATEVRPRREGRDLDNYLSHYHGERNHQGKENIILFPAAADRIGEPSGEIHTRERLGGLLKFYHRVAA